eukprot:1739558-Heterocapsa_arctica.AAC.1
MFKVVAWSMNALLQGIHPTHDEHGAALAPGTDNGQALAKPWTAACIQLRGDWAWHSQALQVPTHRTKEN